MKTSTVGVVGLGTMGHQIALVFAQGGFRTLVMDERPSALEQGLSRISEFLDKRVEKGKLAADGAGAIRGRIVRARAFEELAAAELVVEAVFEDLEVKKKTFRTLDQVCPPGTILASNTSTLSVSELAAATGRPHQCIGAHFLIPAALSPLVELGRGLLTSEETEREVVEVLGKCGKETVTVQDAPAFVINRLYIPLLNEAFFLLQEGVAKPEEIDRACAKGLGHPLGPLAAADASGLDVVLSCVESLHQQLGDKYRPAPLLVKLVKAGQLGKKTGRGVYTYNVK